MSYDSIDLFAGAGGWSVASRNLGLTDLGLEVWGPAVATRNAAGLHSVQTDIRLLNPLDDAYLAPGLIASPPCQQFSAAGKGEGRAYLDTVCALVEHLEWQRASGLPEGAQLIMEPLRWIISRVAVEQPFRWIAMEQVPTCLPVWNSYAVALRKLGYSVAVGKLQAEQYGTPQTRQRAILVAHLEREVALPAPTHSRYYSRDPQRMDEGVLPWVSMAEALDTMEAFEQRSNYSKGGSGGTAEERGRGYRDAAQPASTITSKAFQWNLRSDNRPNSAVRESSAPAPTILGNGTRGAHATWVFAGAGAAALRTAGQQRRALESPAHSTTGASSAAWIDPAQADRDGHVRRVTVQEAGVLQGFPADFPWQGTKGQQYTQAGNAIPVQLAEAVLRAVAL